MADYWTMRHFSLANPTGEGQGDVSGLLRRVAAELDERGSITVHDLVMHTEITADGAWPSITVYYDTAED